MRPLTAPTLISCHCPPYFLCLPHSGPLQLLKVMDDAKAAHLLFSLHCCLASLKGLYPGPCLAVVIWVVVPSCPGTFECGRSRVPVSGQLTQYLVLTSLSATACIFHKAIFFHLSLLSGIKRWAWPLLSPNRNTFHPCFSKQLTYSPSLRAHSSWSIHCFGFHLLLVLGDVQFASETSCVLLGFSFDALSLTFTHWEQSGVMNHELSALSWLGHTLRLTDTQWKHWSEFTQAAAKIKHQPARTCGGGFGVQMLEEMQVVVTANSWSPSRQGPLQHEPGWLPLLFASVFDLVAAPQRGLRLHCHCYYHYDWGHQIKPRQGLTLLNWTRTSFWPFA